MILIFIRYSDGNIPPRLSWDMKERLGSANSFGQASDHAKPSPFAFKDVEELVLAMRLGQFANHLETTSAEAVHWICSLFDSVKSRKCHILGEELPRVAYKQVGLVHAA